MSVRALNATCNAGSHWSPIEVVSTAAAQLLAAACEHMLSRKCVSVQQRPACFDLRPSVLSINVHGCAVMQAELLLERKLEQQRAEVTAQWQRRMESSVADSLSTASRFHKDQLDSQQQKLADSLARQHSEELDALRAR